MTVQRELPTADRPPPANLLLAALPPLVLGRISPMLAVVPLKLKQYLHRPGERVNDVYFPGGGFVSLVTVLNDGSMVELATVGREGMVCVPNVFNGDMSHTATLVQAETDTCYKMPVKSFQREMDRGEEFYHLATRHSHALIGFVAQSTACNAVHSVEQRLARWLLSAQDRVGTTDFPLTQEFVAMMLGTSRPSVTVVAGTLQKAGLIKYHRGHVTIVDREKLEAASCECYQTATALLQSVVAPNTTAPART